MKKILLSLSLTIFVIGANAQSSKIKYQGEVLAGYSIGIGTFSYDRINLHTIQGVRFNPYLSLGVGLGLDYYQKFDLYINTDVTASELAMPIYLNVKGYLPVSTKTNIFLSLDLGASIGLTEGISGGKGLMFTPAVGTNFKISPKNSLSVSLGYNYQAWSESGFKINTDAIALRLGFQF